MEADPSERIKGTGEDISGVTPPAAPEAVKTEGEAAKSEVDMSGANKSEVDRFEVDKSGANKSRAESKSALTRRVTLSSLLCAALVSVFLFLWHKPEFLSRLKTGAERARTVITGQATPTPDPYAEAVAKVEGDRGELTGRSVKVDIPAELKQYKEPHRFLAIQGASADEAGIRSPGDFAELAEMIKEGRELVEAPRLGRGYVIYGVGLTATGELTHYDTERKQSVPLFADDAELKAYGDAVAGDRARLEAESKELEGKLKEVGKKEREERARLLSDISVKKKELDGVKDREKLLASYYGKPRDKERLFAEYGVLAGLAADFGGRAYDLHDTAAAKEFEARMLSFIRPAALSVLEELGAAYQSKFERPLPVTSLVRTVEYQRLLRESGNPNAADVAPPPHTTGLAFDIYYRYMTTAEQEFVMGEIAQLERDGRVEALRELRDHYHVFVFPDGRRPDEKLVEKKLRKTDKKS
jgi:hypothetical protein